MECRLISNMLDHRSGDMNKITIISSLRPKRTSECISPSPCIQIGKFIWKIDSLIGVWCMSETDTNNQYVGGVWSRCQTVWDGGHDIVHQCRFASHELAQGCSEL